MYVYLILLIKHTEKQNRETADGRDEEELWKQKLAEKSGTLCSEM